MNIVPDKIKSLYNDKFLKRLFENTGILLGGTIISNIFGFASLALTTRALGAHQFGQLVLISTYVIIIDRLVNFQSWQAFIKYGAEYKKNKKNKGFKGLIKISTLLDLSTAITGAILSYFLAPIVGNILGWSHEVISYAQLYSIVILFNLDGVPTGVLRLFDRFALFSTQKIITAIFKIVAVGIAYSLRLGLYEFVWIWIFSEILTHLVLFGLGHWILIKNKIVQWWRASIDDWRKVLRFSFWTNVKSTFDLPVQQFDIILVSSMISIEATGVYKILKNVGSLVTKIASPVYQAIFPDFASSIASKEFKEAIAYSKKAGFILFALSFPIAIIIGATSIYWFPYIFGIEIDKWVYAMFAFFLIKSFAAGAITIHPLFVAFGFVKKDAAITLVSNCLYILIAYIGALYLGLSGIIIALAVQILTLTLAKAAIINNKVNFSFF